MRTIRLSRKSWLFDERQPLAPAGGFGRVYAGADGVAVKHLRVAASQAKRELTLADALADRSLAHVVPVLDAGEDADSGEFFVVMAKCDHSLAHYLRKNGLPGVTEAIRILQSIALGLHEVGDIAHRDLKPDNVLFHEGTWKIADFGIARFVEDSTSLNTLKECLTPAYAAPEQWQNERATKATDVYALGCVAHFILGGKPPFEGQEPGDFKHKHLTLDPPDLDSSVPPRLRSLVSHMLRKTQDGRPGLDRVLQVLRTAEDSQRGSGGHGELASIDAAISVETARREAQANAAQVEEEKYIALGREGRADLKKVRAGLFAAVKSSALNATLSEEKIALGLGALCIQVDAVSRPTTVGKWRVAATGKIYANQSGASPFCWAASLWFTDAGEGREFRWYQLSFMTSPLSRQSRADEPFAASPTSAEAGQAFSNAIALYQLAEKSRPIDGECVDAFEREWIARFTNAAKGQLQRPRQLPWN